MPKLSYEPVSTNENISVVKKKGFLCASSRKRLYVLLILFGVALLWVFIYYKLLNHRFELPEPLQRLRKMFGDGKVKKRGGREDLTENIDIDKSETMCLPQFETERNKHVIHLAIVACGKNFVKEALVALKAITLVTNHYLYIHIFTDDKHFLDTFDKEFEDWPAWTQRWMMFTVHPIFYPPSINSNEWLSMFKPCATQRLFLANVLTRIDSVIYIDTDVLFLESPENLWKLFKRFNNTQIAGMVNECEYNNVTKCWYNSHALHPYYGRSGLNSGVMLMNLTRMRKVNWELKLISIFEKYKHQKEVLTWGDQDILNVYFHEYGHSLYLLPCTWNYRPEFCMHGNVCEIASLKGISALHGSREVFKKKNHQPEFYIVHEAYRKFSFGDDFQEKVVNATSCKLTEKYRHTGCGRMRDAILKHIRC